MYSAIIMAKDITMSMAIAVVVDVEAIPAVTNDG